LTSAFWPAIGAAALGEKEAKAERSKLWLANYEERQQALEARREARRRTRLGLPAISAKPVDVLSAEARAPTAPAPGAIMTFRQDTVQQRTAGVTTGSFGYERLFEIGSTKAGEGNLLVAAEAARYNGPWVMYGRRPRCKRNLTISEAFGCGHVFGL
jgi:hypothetical protein